MSGSQEQDLPYDSKFYVPEELPIGSLQITSAFELLTQEEQLYAYYLTRGAAAMAPAMAAQVSAEAPALLELLFEILKQNSEDLAALPKAFLNYVAKASSQNGNYVGFGDTKFVPRLPKSEFSALAAQAGSRAAELWAQVGDAIYSLEDARQLSFANSAYYWPGATQEEVERIDAALKQDFQNTEITKLASGEYQVLVGSVEERVVPLEVEGAKASIRYGHYSKQLAHVVTCLEKAKEHAANERQKTMLDQYVAHFRTGDYNTFWESQKTWVKDVGPSIESNLGYVETYRDPKGVRAELEFFVAAVNRERSKAFAQLVESAAELLPVIPWPREMKKDTFYPPDFTSLDILSFTTSGMPSGINIPNNNMIRQEIGFKNVQLGNVMAAKVSVKRPLLSAQDAALLDENLSTSYAIQVGLHELLGHGSGKLFLERDDGTYNFDDKERLKSGRFYKKGETWSSVFKDVASSMEECRADAVGIYLCSEPRVSEIFGVEQVAEGEVADVVYVNYMSNILQGLKALSFYSEERDMITQAHLRGRFVILQTLLQAGRGLVTITEEGETDLKIALDRSKILTVARPAIGRLLNTLMTYRATADYTNGSKWYLEISKVTDDWKKLIPRVNAARAKAPRPSKVQGNLLMKDGKVISKEYEASAVGAAWSFLDRYCEDDLVNWKV